MPHKNHTQNPVPGKRFEVVYQAWSEDDRPALEVTLSGSMAADHDFTTLVTTWWQAPQSTPTATPTEEN